MIWGLLQNLKFKTQSRSGHQPGRLVRRYFVYSVFLIGGGLISSGLLEIYFRYQESHEGLGLLQQEVATGAAFKTEQFVKQIETTMWMATKSPVVARKGLSEELQAELTRLLLVTPAIEEAMILDLAGQVRLQASRFKAILPEERQEVPAQAAFDSASKGVSYFGPVTFARDSEPYNSVAVPIERYPGDVIGLLWAKVNLKYIWEVIQDIKIGTTGYAYIVTRSGDLVAHPDLSSVLRRENLAQLRHVQVAFQTGSPQRDEHSLKSRSLQGKNAFVSYAHIPRLDWAVFVEQPLSEAYAPLYASMVRTSSLLLIGFGLALLASVLVARRVVRPLQALRLGVDRIGKGDLDHEIQIKTGDEIEILADAFNKMVGEIKNSYQSLEDKVRQRTKELAALLDVTATATQSLDFNEVLQQVAEKITEIFELDATRIYLFDRQRQKLLRRAVSGHDAELYREFFIKGAGLVGRVAEIGEPVVFSDLQTDPRYIEMTNDGALKKLGFRFFAIFPIKARGVTLGTISCNSKQSRLLSTEEVRLISSLVDQIGPAIENLNLFEEVKEKTVQLETANRELSESLAQQTAVAQTLRVMANSPSNLQAVFDAILSDAGRLTKATGGVVRLLDAAGILRFVAHFSIDVQHSWKFQDFPVRADENSASTRAIRERRAVQIRDIQSEESNWHGPVDMPPAHSVLAVPLIQESNPVGVLVVFRHVIEPFTDQQVELLTTFADEAVVAIKNVNLFQELQARTRELEAANERLKQLDKLKSDFLSNVSHELRTPLTAIGSLVDNMLDGLTGSLNAKQSRYVSGIKESTERLARLIHDLLDLSVIESGRIELKMTQFSLPSLIREVVRILTPVAQEKSIALGLPSMNGNQVAWADRDKINQVLTNLISNAVKFTPSAGKVTLALETTDDGRWIQVGVSDTGPGIPPAEARLIFDEFYQINRPGQEKAKGVGLGLAICKKLVDMHGGRIRVESAVGHGSTFYFTVPAHRKMLESTTVNSVKA